jgi:hypothetical protein
MKRLIAIGVLSALFGASCSGGGSTAPTSSPLASVVTTDVVSTTVAVTVPPTSSTAAATTTVPATTTTIATEDLIKQAVQDYSTAYHQCGAVPADCQPDTFTAVQGHSRATLHEFASGLVGEGLYFSTDRRGSYLVSESISLPSPTEAIAVFCVFDAGTVLGPNGPDGLPTVVNDEVLSLRNEYSLFLENGSWRVGEKQELARLGEGSLCPPAA